MRIEKSKIDFLKNEINKHVSNFKLVLFGSRVYDDQKGGDIDILLLTGQKIERKTIRRIKIAFYKQFGEQKLDLVVFGIDEPSNFKSLALLEGVEL
jgi:predicted nucleotidyltransferase